MISVGHTRTHRGRQTLPLLPVCHLVIKTRSATLSVPLEILKYLLMLEDPLRLVGDKELKLTSFNNLYKPDKPEEYTIQCK